MGCGTSCQRGNPSMGLYGQPNPFMRQTILPTMVPAPGVRASVSPVLVRPTPGINYGFMSTEPYNQTIYGAGDTYLRYDYPH